MAKKHKKVFKQKLKQMLVAAESVPVAPSSQSVPPVSSAQAPVVKSNSSPILLIEPDLVKSDLKKIGLLFLIILLLIAATVVISEKTNWLFIVADKIYNWARLGA